MDSAEFGRYILSQKDRMYRLARSILYDPADAEDVVQDVFMKLWARKDGLDSYGNIGSLVLTAVRNSCLDVIRGRKVREDRRSEVYRHTEQVSDMSRKIEADDMKRAVEDIIRLLPEKQRTVIHMRDVEGCDFSEIAVVIGSDEAAVRMNLSRARKTVKEKLITVMGYGTRK